MTLPQYTNEDGYNSLIKGGVQPVAGYLKACMVPIGSIVAWTKSTTGCPTLPDGWVECNGGTLSDASSPFNGQAIPDLNVTQRFLRGKTTSGTTGGSDTHNHSWSVVGTDLQSGTNFKLVNSTNADSNVPAYMEVVWIWRVK